MGLREFVKVLKVKLRLRKEYAVLEPPPVPPPPPPPPPLVLWETWEGVSDEVLDEALEAIYQDLEQQLEEGQEVYRGKN